MVVLELKHPESSSLHNASIYYIEHWTGSPSFTKKVVHGELKEKLVLVDATKILSIKHLLFAIYNAFFPSKSHKRLKTLQTQVLYNLSVSKNISQSLSIYGAKKDACFLIGLDEDLKIDTVLNWVNENQNTNNEEQNQVRIIESLEEMDDLLRNNGSIEWIKKNIFPDKDLSFERMESLLLTMLGVKDV